MADANRVVAAVKTRAHPQTLTPAAKPQPDVGVLQVLTELSNRNERHKLARPHPHQCGHGCGDQAGEHIVEQVVAVVAPHRHLALRMVQGMERPPALPLVLPTVNPVIDEVEQHQVEHKTHPGLIGHTGPEAVQVPGGQARGTQMSQALLKQGIETEKHGQLEQAQPVNQGVEHVHPHCLAIAQWLGRPQALRRPYQQQHDRHLDQAHQQPARAFVGFFQQVGLAGQQGERLHPGFKQPLVGQREGVGQGVHGL